MKTPSLVGLLALIGLVFSVVAEEELPDAGITPDSMLYGLDRAFERISLALTFDRAAKAEKHLEFASERIAELKTMVDKGEPEFVEELKKDHERELSAVESEIEGARALGRNVTALAEHVADVTSKHIVVLERVLEKVPDQAKPAIMHAINVSQRGREKAVESILKEKGRPENVTRGKPENKTQGGENITRGKPENVTRGKPDNVTKDRLDDDVKGRPENLTKGKPEDVTKGKPENITKGGRPEDDIKESQEKAARK